MTAVAAAKVKLAAAEKHKIAIPLAIVGNAQLSQSFQHVIDMPAAIALAKAHETGFAAASVFRGEFGIANCQWHLHGA